MPIDSMALEGRDLVFPYFKLVGGEGGAHALGAPLLLSPMFEIEMLQMNP